MDLSKLRLACVLLALLALGACVQVSASDVVGSDATPFNVKPDGQTKTVEFGLDDSSVCEFSYAAMGGTNEDWKLRINKLADGRLVCVVERPERASYLYFQHFSVTLKAPVDVVKTIVLDSTEAALLQGSEWDVSADQLVASTPGFKGSLRHLELWTK